MNMRDLVVEKIVRLSPTPINTTTTWTHTKTDAELFHHLLMMLKEEIVRTIDEVI